jgi:hypothetical protein
MIANKFYAKINFYTKSLHFIRIYPKVTWPFYKKEGFFFFFLIRFHTPFRSESSSLSQKSTEVLCVDGNLAGTQPLSAVEGRVRKG